MWDDFQRMFLIGAAFVFVNYKVL